jgi:CHASE1-domain containing sensor protein
MLDLYNTEYNERIYTSLNGVTSRLNTYEDILYDGRAFVRNSPGVGQKEWNGYFTDQNLAERFPGVSAVFHIQRVPNEQLQPYLSEMKKRFGSDYTLHPAGDRPDYGLIDLITSKNNVTNLLGFDAFNEKHRAAIYAAASATGLPAASAPMMLASGHRGILLVLPDEPGKQERDGYLGASFRVDDLLKAVLSSRYTVLQYRISDVTEQKTVPVYTTPDWAKARWSRQQATIKFADRQWLVEMGSDKALPIRLNRFFMPILSMAIALLVILLFINHSRHRLNK